MRRPSSFAPLLFAVLLVGGCSSGDGGSSDEGGDAVVEDSGASGHDGGATDVGTDASADSHAHADVASDAPPSDAPSDAASEARDAPDAPDTTVGDVVIGDLVIMPFGDSITGEPHTYREPLYGSLTTAGCTVHFVGSQTDVYATIPEKNHEGHPGFTIGDMAKSTDGWIAAAPAKIVLMMIGTNDIAWWYAGTAAEVGDAHAKLMDEILADEPGVWLIVASIPPESSTIVEPNKYDRADFTNLVNAEIEKHVDERIAAGKKVRFADVNAALTVADLRDGIHPTTAGYAKVADAWLHALQPIAACLGAKP
jgi:hypothetical protein